MAKILSEIHHIVVKINAFLRKFAKTIFRIFEVSIIIKGIDGILEIIGSGILFYVAKPERMDRIVLLLTEHELSQDPDDTFANLITGLGQHLSVGGARFGAIYLLAHACIKIFMVTMLLSKKMWAYPVVAVALVGFAGYQIYRFTHTHSAPLIFFSCFDIFTAILTILVYRQLKKEELHRAKVLATA